MLIRAGMFIRMRAFRQKKIQLSSFISSKDMDFISDAIFLKKGFFFIIFFFIKALAFD